MAVSSRVLAWMVLATLASGASAQGMTDPGDLAFWQSIQSSKAVDEYRAYLHSYPNGRYAELARVRVQQLGGSAPVPNGGTRATAPGPTPMPDAGPDPSVSLTPPNGRVGQRFTVNCVNFPQENSSDKLVIVPAGTPVMDPTRSREQSGALWSNYGANCSNPGSPGYEAGPFAPGAYEVRWMTTLYNNESPIRYEMKAMTAFIVR